MRFDRTVPEQVWRFLTAHFIHLSWAHTALNAAGVVLCGVLAPGLLQGWGFWLRTGLLCLAVSGGLWFFSPQVTQYVGFSGVLYGLFVLGLLPQALARDRGAGIVLAAISAWMLWQAVGAPLAAEERMIGGAIIGVAHLYGYGGGWLLWGFSWCTARRWSRSIRTRPAQSTR